MANAISSIKMANPIKQIVSKQRIRYVEDGFNLDLAYINENIIAMGFPGEKIEGFYRNHIGDVIKFLETKHDGKYKIYNLCSERSYDVTKFQQWAVFPFADHNPPRIEQIQHFCSDVDDWLKVKERVAAVHCKAGKGRTGTMICCYLLHSGEFNSADEALRYYGGKRAHDRKGVTIPSQRRYVEYFEYLKNNPNDPYRQVPVNLVKLKLTPPFHSFHPGSYHFSIHKYVHNPETDCFDKLSKVYCAPVPDFKKNQQNGSDPGCISIDVNLADPISGEIKIEFYSKNVMKKQKLLQFWFNTFFASKSTPDSEGNLTYTLWKQQIDDAHKDKTHRVFPETFHVDVILQMTPPVKNHNNHNQQQLENSNHTNHNHLRMSAVPAHTNGADNWESRDNGAGNNKSFLKANMGGQQLPTSTANSNLEHVSDTVASGESSASNSVSSIEEDWDSGKPTDFAYSKMDKAGNSARSKKHYRDEDNYYKAGAVATTSSTASVAVAAVCQPNTSFFCDTGSNNAAMTHNFEKQLVHGLSDKGPDEVDMRKNSLTDVNSRKKTRSTSMPKASKMKFTSSSAKANHNNNFNPLTNTTSASLASHSSKASKIEWLKNKRSDSGFCLQLPNNVTFKPTPSAVKIMRNSNDSLNSDLYSALVDNKLSFEASPSPLHGFKLRNETPPNDPPKSAIVITKVDISKRIVGFDMAKSVVQSELEKPKTSSAPAASLRGCELFDDPKLCSLSPKSENSSFQNFMAHLRPKKSATPTQQPVSQQTQSIRPVVHEEGTGLVKSLSMSNMFFRKQTPTLRSVNSVAFGVGTVANFESSKLESKIANLQIDEEFTET